MKSSPIIALLALATVPAVASERPYAVKASEIARSAEAYYQEHVTVRSMRCVAAEPGLSCVTDASGRMLKVDAKAIGGSDKTLAAFVQGCAGSANVSRSACRMDVSFTPLRHTERMADTGAGFEPIVTFEAERATITRPR
jgi:hypothetical protein